MKRIRSFSILDPNFETPAELSRLEEYETFGITLKRGDKVGTIVSSYTTARIRRAWLTLVILICVTTWLVWLTYRIR